MTRTSAATEEGAGADELAALAAYCTATDDEILAAPAAPAAPDTALWASARLLDGLGIVVHGSRTPVAQVARTVFGSPQAGAGGVHAWPDTTSACRADDAAYLLGVYAFSENYADTGLGSVAHVNSVVVPALLVGIQQHRVTGRQALAALVVGYTVMEWIGTSLNGGRPRMAHQLRGFRPTPTAGPIAAVAVLGRLAGLSAGELGNALGLACSQGGGLRPSTPSPVAAIRIQSGEALRRAVHTLALARSGIQSPPDILRCPGGFFPAYTFSEPGPGTVPVAGRPPDLLRKVSMKLECTPHTLVTMLDAARALAAAPGFAPDSVAAVTVRVPAQHDVISGGAKPYPAAFSEAVGHVPYCVALAMVTGSHLYPEVIRAGLDHPAVRELTAKVSLVVDERLTALFNDDLSSWPAAVELRDTAGRTAAVDLLVPETAGWTASDALRHAAAKTAALLENRAGNEAELIAGFAVAPQWPDAWAAISRHPLAGRRHRRPAMAVDLGYAGTAAIVTGGTRGIGKAVVRLLLDEGAYVLAAGSRPETAGALAAELGHERLRAVAQDMRADDCGERLVAEAVSAFGRIDLVVNNAAAFDYVSADALQRRDWLDLFTLKALGYWSLARAATAELTSRRGAVVNVSGIAGITASAGSPSVGAVNAAVISMTESMAQALAPRGVRVNAVSPGATDTDRFATRISLLAARDGIDADTARDRLAGAVPVGHPAGPGELALAIAVLGAPVMRSVTGAHLVVDGASTLGSRRHG